jgi:hypothetical protein
MSLIESARVVKLVDAGDSKSPAARRAGSIPAPGTTVQESINHPENPGSSIRYQFAITTLPHSNRADSKTQLGT